MVPGQKKRFLGSRSSGVEEWKGYEGRAEGYCRMDGLSFGSQSRRDRGTGCLG